MAFRAPCGPNLGHVPLRTGLTNLVSTHLGSGSAIAVAGEAAADLAEALVREGAPPLTIEADRFALLSAELDPPAVGRVRDEDVAGLWSGIRRRGWRGSAWVSQERARSTFEDVSASMAGAVPAGWTVDREPWYAVVGRRR